MNDLYLTDLDARIRWTEIPGDEPVRVYVHGLGSAATFDYPHIAAHPSLAGRRSLLVDLLGFGLSDRPEAFAYTLEEHATTLAAVLDRLGVIGAEIVGHSMGGSVAIVMAAGRPDLVSRLVVAEPNLDPGGGPTSRAIAAYSEEEFVRSGIRKVIAEQSPGYAARLRLADPVGVHRSAVGLVKGTEPTMSELFLALPRPRAYVVGARNRPDPSEPRLAAEGIPVLEVPDAGHDMMHDNPEGFALALAAALTERGRQQGQGPGER